MKVWKVNTRCVNNSLKGQAGGEGGCVLEKGMRGWVLKHYSWVGAKGWELRHYSWVGPRGGG